MAREHAAGAKTAKREHLFERLGINSAQHEIGLQAFADLVFARAGGFMKAQGQIERFQSVPQRLVIIALPLVIDQRIGAQKTARKPSARRSGALR